jgi:lipopolysaccharide transport system permease protein
VNPTVAPAAEWTAESASAVPMWRRPIELVRQVVRHRQLVWDLVKRDLAGRYVGSSMGLFWSVVFPLVQLAVFMFVFRIMLRARWGDAHGERETALVMLAGILVWTAFAETVSRSTNSLVENANLIRKVVFPSQVLPPYLAISSLVNMLIGLPIVVLGVALFTDGSVGAPLLAVPVLLVLQAIFTLGLAYVFAAFNLFFRDTFHLMGVALTVWMFCTPIFYPPEMVTHASVTLGEWAGGREIGFGWLLELNPMHWLIAAWRDVLCADRWPVWSDLARFAGVGAVLFAAGATFFETHRRRFPDLL